MTVRLHRAFQYLPDKKDSAEPHRFRILSASCDNRCQKAFTSSMAIFISAASSGIFRKSVWPLVSTKQVLPKLCAFRNSSAINVWYRVHSPPLTVIPLNKGKGGSGSPVPAQALRTLRSKIRSPLLAPAPRTVEASRLTSPASYFNIGTFHQVPSNANHIGIIGIEGKNSAYSP